MNTATPVDHTSTTLRLPIITTGLDDTHKTHLLDRLKELRQDFAAAKVEAAKLSIRTEADQLTQQFARERSLRGSDAMKLRRGVSDFVEGQADLTKLTERLATYQAGVANAVLAERESQSQSIGIKA
jgi:hypothetical protein